MREHITLEREDLLHTRIREERRGLVEQLDAWLETPMVVLGFVWLLLLVIELTGNLSPFMESLGTFIWVVFIADFALKFAVAPDKLGYLKRNWLVALSLLVPALRVFRVVRLFRVLQAGRAVRGLRLFKVLTSLNRGMRALGASFGRRGFGYIIALTCLVIFGGAAGMLAFENGLEGGISTYGDSVWWTAMMITTIGSDYFPRTVEGRILCFLLALYGFGVFGYVTATLATFFVGREAAAKDTELPGTAELRNLRREVAELRREIKLLTDKIGVRD